MLINKANAIVARIPKKVACHIYPPEASPEKPKLNSWKHPSASYEKISETFQFFPCRPVEALTPNGAHSPSTA
jgi:hypothetical protein